MAQPPKSRVALGIGLLALGATCNAVGVGMTVSPTRDDDPASGIFWIVVSLAGMMIPGALLVIAGRRLAKRTARIEKIVALANASERLPFAQLAEDLGVQAPAARELLLEAIAQGRVVGRLDLEKGVFLSASTHGGVRQVTMTCRGCGAKSAVVVSASSVSLCGYCGFRMA